MFVRCIGLILAPPYINLGDLAPSSLDVFNTMSMFMGYKKVAYLITKDIVQKKNMVDTFKQPPFNELGDSDDYKLDQPDEKL
jgi:hypothetical protein